MNTPQAILPAPKLNKPHGVMHAVLPQKTKFKFFSNKGIYYFMLCISTFNKSTYF